MNTSELRQQTASKLMAATDRAGQMTAFIGFDGFVDEILHVVDKRTDADQFVRLFTIAQLAGRLQAAAGQSTNIELVNQRTKLGGNGPIMANALASLGLRVTYLGGLGYPSLHPVFAEFARRAEVHSIAEPARTDALEFEDGKIMLGKLQSLREVNWENIKTRFGRERFAAHLGGSDLIGFVNWTMLTSMSEIWAAVLEEVCPGMKGPRRKLFIDLADPEKRTREDIAQALKLLGALQHYFDVILGINEKECCEIGKNLGLSTSERDAGGLLALGRRIRQRLDVDTVVVHPTACALAAGPGGDCLVEGPFTSKPKITTGAGDHFNSGFCLGQLLGFTLEQCLLTGVTTSGFYVRTGQSPSLSDLAEMLRNWPE